jgi:two-component system, OmpR family, KDP operon response regulator KdpE
VSSILVIGSVGHRRRLTTTALRHGGLDTKVVSSIDRAARVVRRHRLLGIVVVDAVPPPAEVIHDLRTRTDAPIVVVSEYADAATRIAGLDAGADDYITFPFDIEEFLARLRATMRRFDRSTDDEAPIVTDDFTVHLSDRRLVLADGTDAPLSPTEWRLVEVLLSRPGHLLGREDILRAVWGPSASASPGLLRVNLAGIRRKVEPDPSRPRYFLTVPGLGLRFAPSVPSARGSAS